MLKIVKDVNGGSCLRIGRRWEVRLVTHQWHSLFHPRSSNWIDFTFIDIGGELSWYNYYRFEFRVWLLGVGIHVDRWTSKHDVWRWPEAKEPA